MSIEIKRIECVIIDENTAQFLRVFVDELARVACEFSDGVYEVDNLCEAIDEFLGCERVRVE